MSSSATAAAAAAAAEKAPPELLISFFREATRELESFHHSRPKKGGEDGDDEPMIMTLVECREFILEKQTSCLERVITEYNSTNNNRHDVVSVEQMRYALASLSSSSSSTTTNNNNQNDATNDQQQKQIQQSMEEMNQAARIAYARLVLSMECFRSKTNSLVVVVVVQEKETTTTNGSNNHLKTSRMGRSDIVEFCALCRATIRIDSVQNHLHDPIQHPQLLLLLPLEDEDTTAQQQQQQSPQATPSVVKRIENLQRFILQSMGYDPDIGLAELVRQVKLHHENQNDDVELVRMIQETTDLLLQAALGGNANPLLSDKDQGGVTRVVSVQHSEKIVQIGTGTEGEDATATTTTTTADGAPISQSMRGGDDDNNNDQQFQMAQKAAALRESLVKELQSMTTEDRNALLQEATKALQNFQQRALAIPPGIERIQYMRNGLDPNTQKLLAMHRIWQEEQQQQQQQQLKQQQQQQVG